MTDLMPAHEFLIGTFMESLGEPEPRETVEAACNLFAAVACALAEDDEDAVRGYLARLGGPAERAIARAALLRAARLAAESYDDEGLAPKR